MNVYFVLVFVSANSIFCWIANENGMMILPLRTLNRATFVQIAYFSYTSHFRFKDCENLNLNH